MIQLTVNRRDHEIDVDPETPLLWVLREKLGLTGTKYGCGMAQCGACTVHVDGQPLRSCVAPAGTLAGRKITTIEGLAAEASLPGGVLQQAWIDEEVPQCGWCQPGQLMSAAALLHERPAPSDGDIDDAMAGNVCRCGTYPRIRRAIHCAAGKLAHGAAK